MNHKDTCNLSIKFAPPKIDLRKAQIPDNNGDDSYAQLLVNHKKPDDARRQEFDYYEWIYSFMEPGDLFIISTNY